MRQRAQVTLEGFEAFGLAAESVELGLHGGDEELGDQGAFA